MKWGKIKRGGITRKKEENAIVAKNKAEMAHEE
jgi:hypothetical protein